MNLVNLFQITLISAFIMMFTNVAKADKFSDFNDKLDLYQCDSENNGYAQKLVTCQKNAPIAKPIKLKKYGCHDARSWYDTASTFCYSCPPGYTHNGWFIASNKNVCTKVSYSKGIKGHNTGSILKACPKDQWADLGSTQCYKCPNEYKHNSAYTHHNKNFCKKTSYHKGTDKYAPTCEARPGSQWNGLDGYCYECPAGLGHNPLARVDRPEVCQKKGIVFWNFPKPPSKKWCYADLFDADATGIPWGVRYGYDTGAGWPADGFRSSTLLDAVDCVSYHHDNHSWKLKDGTKASGVAEDLNNCALHYMVSKLKIPNDQTRTRAAQKRIELITKPLCPN